MEWFKHSTGSHEDPDISDAWDTFGDAGPLIFWTVLEVFGAEYSHLKDGWLTLSIPYFERKTRRKFKKSENILGFFQNRGRIFFNKQQQSISITIPKFIKIASNWTVRPKDEPTAPPTEAPTEAPTAKEEEEKKKRREEEIIKDKKEDLIFPEWIDKPTWESFLEMRKSIGAKPTAKAIPLLIAKLGRLRSDGHDPQKVLEQSIMNNYKGVFPVKGGVNGGGNGYSNSERQAFKKTGNASSDGAAYPVDAEC